MKINVKLTKQQNADFYGVPVSSVYEMSFKEYLYGVVASEIGASYMEACRAQAVASRTLAAEYALQHKVISDSSSSAQAFNAEKAFDNRFTVAHRAVDDTDGEVLHYNGAALSPCSFSASNGGKTVSSESRWGGARPYLIEQDDPWDFNETHGKKTGHGVGMSQKGAIYAAKTGVSYKDILSFYYPGAVLVKEGLPMASIKASDLIQIFNKMAEEKWKYVAGAHRQGEVDCSGAFYYAYKQLGGYMYHGSNTMWRTYTVNKGKIGSIDLVPGMAVFKKRDWNSSQSSNTWYDTDPGDVYHVGLYIGNNKVVEAKGVKHGVVITDISTWHLAATLKNTIYDKTEPAETNNDKQDIFETRQGVVKINSGWLNLRKERDTSSERMGKLYGGDVVTVIGSYDDWYELSYKGKSVYVKNKFIELIDAEKPKYILTVTIFGDDELDRMTKAISDYGYKASITKGGVAA